MNIAEDKHIKKSAVKTFKLLLACLIVFAVSYYYLSYYRNYLYGLFADEGYIMYGAKRILEGQILYKDFFQFYPPGDFYLLALIFKLFGYGFTVARETTIIIQSLITSIYFYLGYKAIKSWHVILLPFFIIRISFLNFMQYSHYWSSMLFLFIALALFLQYLEQNKNLYLYLTGFFIGITGLFLQTTGAYAALLFLLVFILERIKEQDFKRHLILFLIGISVPLVVAFGYIAYQGALWDFIKEQYFISRVYGSWGTLNPLLLYFKNVGPISLIFLLYVITAILSFIVLIIQKNNLSSQTKIILMGNIILFFNTVTRIDYLHILINASMAFVVIVVVLKWIIGSTSRVSKNLYKLLQYGFGAVFAFFIIWGIISMGTEVHSINKSAYHINIYGIRVWTFSSKQAYNISEFFPQVEKHLHGDKNVFVYPYCPLVYVLFHFNNPTFTDLIPTIMDIPNYGTYSFNSVVQFLLRKKTDYVVYCDVPGNYIKDVTILKAGRYRTNVLDEYISNSYTPVLRVNDLILYKKK